MPAAWRVLLFTKIYKSDIMTIDSSIVHNGLCAERIGIPGHLGEFDEKKFFAKFRQKCVGHYVFVDGGIFGLLDVFIHAGCVRRPDRTSAWE